jgi:hypothetical protein
MTAQSKDEDAPASGMPSAVSTRVTGAGTPVAAVRLPIDLLRFPDSRPAIGKLPQILTVRREVNAAGLVDFVVPVGLGIIVHVVVIPLIDSMEWDWGFLRSHGRSPPFRIDLRTLREGQEVVVPITICIGSEIARPAIARVDDAHF